MARKTKLDAFKELIKIAIPDVEKYDFYHLKGDAFNKELKAFSARLGKKWNDSNFSDYSIYQSEEYLIECIWTHVVSSGAAIDNTIKYFKSITNPGQCMSIVDIYNGIGLTTRLLKENFSGTISYFNDIENQIAAANRLSPRGQYSSFRELPVDYSFDIVVCLETIEHYHEPMGFTQQLMDMSREYLVETTSFCSPQHCGHFKEYLVKGQLVSGMTASRRVHDLIRSEFTQVFSGYNGRPRIWKRHKQFFS